MDRNDLIRSCTVGLTFGIVLATQTISKGLGMGEAIFQSIIYSLVGAAFAALMIAIINSFLKDINPYVTFVLVFIACVVIGTIKLM